MANKNLKHETEEIQIAIIDTIKRKDALSETIKMLTEELDEIRHSLLNTLLVMDMDTGDSLTIDPLNRRVHIVQYTQESIRREALVSEGITEELIDKAATSTRSKQYLQFRPTNNFTIPDGKPTKDETQKVTQWGYNRGYKS